MPFVDQAAGDEGQPEQHRQKGQQRRDRAGPALGIGSANQRAQRQDHPGDGQIDQPRPVDVGAAMRRVEAMLDEVEPALPVEQGADLRDAHIVVGVAQREAAHLPPAGEQRVSRVTKPEQDDDQLPVAHRPRIHPLDQIAPPLPNVSPSL
mgnify:CR=1 FL=1